MNRPPSVVVFDVNETLSDMAPMSARFTDVGVPDHLASTWFAMLLRDGFALAAAGGSERFVGLGEGVLRQLLHDTALDRDLNAAVEHIMGGFQDLPVHPDVPDGVRALRRAGLRLVTLSNGATDVAERLLSRAGIREEFEALLSVEQAGVWKPARGSYEYAARVCATDLAGMLLVAVHPWDISGAFQAGMSTAWVNRNGGPYPDYFAEPTLQAATLTELADALLRR